MNFRKSTSLSAAVLCAMATFVGGCADTEGDEPAVETQKAAITSRGIAVAGCGGTALFDVFNNSTNINQAINSIAVDQSAINNVTSQLWSVNSQNQLSQVTQQSSAVSQDMAYALSNFTNNTNAYQRASAWQQANVSQYAAANTTTIASHYDSADTWNNSISDVYSSNSGYSSRNVNAYNRAWGDQLAARNANTGMYSSNFADSVNGFSSFQSNAAFMSNNFLPFGLFGAGGFNAANVSNVAAANAFGSNRVASANQAWANTNVSDLARSGYLTSANTNVNQANSFFNSARALNQASNRTSVANAATTVSSVNRADALNSSTGAMQDSMASQNAWNNGTNAVSSSNFLSNTQAFTNLNQISSQNYVLQLNFNAISEQAFTSLFALNQNNNILTSNNFNFSFPGCGVGGVGVGPVILPPADAPAEAQAMPGTLEVGPALAREERE